MYSLTHEQEITDDDVLDFKKLGKINRNAPTLLYTKNPSILTGPVVRALRAKRVTVIVESQNVDPRNFDYVFEPVEPDSSVIVADVRGRRRLWK